MTDYEDYVERLQEAIHNDNDWKVKFVAKDGMVTTNAMPLIIFCPTLKEALKDKTHIPSPVVIMPDFEIASIKIILDFMKTGHIKISVENVDAFGELVTALKINLSQDFTVDDPRAEIPSSDHNETTADTSMVDIENCSDSESETEHSPCPEEAIEKEITTNGITHVSQFSNDERMEEDLSHPENEVCPLNEFHASPNNPEVAPPDITDEDTQPATDMQQQRVSTPLPSLDSDENSSSNNDNAVTLTENNSPHEIVVVVNAEILESALERNFPLVTEETRVSQCASLPDKSNSEAEIPSQSNVDTIQPSSDSSDTQIVTENNLPSNNENSSFSIPETETNASISAGKIENVVHQNDQMPIPRQQYRLCVSPISPFVSQPTSPFTTECSLLATAINPDNPITFPTTTSGNQAGNISTIPEPSIDNCAPPPDIKNNNLDNTTHFGAPCKRERMDSSSDTSHMVSSRDNEKFQDNVKTSVASCKPSAKLLTSVSKNKHSEKRKQKHKLKADVFCEKQDEPTKKKVKLEKKVNISSSTHSEKYNCKICSSGFKHRREYDLHKQQHFIETLDCRVCCMKFLTYTEKMNHPCKVAKKSNSFYCFICEKTFGEKCVMLTHRQQHMVCKSECPKCHNKYPEVEDLMNHIRKHTQECNKYDVFAKQSSNQPSSKSVSVSPESMKCKVCGEGFKDAFEKVKHTCNVGDSLYRYKCDICSRMYAENCVLIVHKLQHFSAPTSKECPICKKNIESISDLLAHVRNHTGEDITSIATTSSSNKSEKSILKCNECDNHYNSEAKLLIHLQRHSKRSQKQCPFCNHVSVDLDASAEHVDQHLGFSHDKGARTCSLCHAYFESDLTFFSHRSLHEDKFDCPMCTASFPVLSDLINHMKHHQRDLQMNLTCKKKCQKPQRSLGAILLHYAGYCETNQPVCPLCSLLFDNVDKCTAHLDRHLQGMELKCDSCSSSLKSLVELIRHAEKCIS